MFCSSATAISGGFTFLLTIDCAKRVQIFRSRLTGMICTLQFTRCWDLFVSMDDTSDDKALMLRFQTTGEVGAFEALFRRHKDALFTFALRLCGNRAIAEDISQHTWFRILEVAKAGGFRVEDASFRTYLYRIGRNFYVDEYRRKHDSVRTEPLRLDIHEKSDDFNGSEADLVDQDLKQALGQALSRVPFEQREVLAFWADGVPLDVVSEITGVSKHTLVSRKKYGLKKLKAAATTLGLEELLQ